MLLDERFLFVDHEYRSYKAAVNHRAKFPQYNRLDILLSSLRIELCKILPGRSLLRHLFFYPPDRIMRRQGGRHGEETDGAAIKARVSGVEALWRSIWCRIPAPRRWESFSIRWMPSTFRQLGGAPRGLRQRPPRHCGGPACDGRLTVVSAASIKKFSRDLCPGDFQTIPIALCP